MNTIWHIVRKDLHRALWPAVGWLSLTVVPILVGWWIMAGGKEVLTLPFRPEIQPIWFIFRTVLVFLITAIVVYEDRLFGSTAHWTVLPISGGRLLVAKVCSLLIVFWALPLAVLLPWWLANGFGVGAVFRAVTDQGALLLAPLAAALAVSSITNSMGRLLVWSLVLGILLIGGVYSGLALANEFGGASLTGEVWKSRLWISATLIAATPIAVIVHQFLRRRERVSIGLFAIGGIAAWLVLSAWPWAVLPNWSSKTSAVQARPASLEISWQEPEVLKSQTFASGPDGVTWMTFRSLATVSGMEPGDTWTAVIRSIRLAWPDGTEFIATDRVEGRGVERFGRNQGYATVDELSSEASVGLVETELWFRTQIPERLLAKMRREPTTFDAVVEGYQTQREHLVELPLEASQTARYESRQLRIVSVEAEGQSGRVFDAVFKQPALGFWKSVVPPALLVPAQGLDLVQFINRADSKSARALGRWGRRYGQTIWTGIFAGVEVSRQRFRVLTPGMVNGGPVPGTAEADQMDSEWVLDARLSIVREVVVQRFDANFATERLRVPERAEDPWPGVQEWPSPINSGQLAAPRSPNR